MRHYPICLLFAATLVAQPRVDFEGRPSVAISNDRLELVVTLTGGALASVTLKDDSAKLNPLWNPSRMQRELGQKPGTGGATGHFVCVDGFGPTSPEERAAGLPVHGEAYRQPVEIKTFSQDGGVTALAFESKLPIVQEVFRRTIHVRNGEQVVWVDSELESLVGFDRPACWAEHATIGSPFLEPGQTVVDMPAVKAKTRVHPAGQGPVPRRLASDREFTWPFGPLVSGGTVDLRVPPDRPNSLDHTTCLLDTGRPVAFVTALHPGKRMLLGYVFRQKEYPWLQCWDNYHPSGKMSRGIEFSSQPFDVPRREVIDLRSLFAAPVYRWLPAKSKIASRFAMFYTRTPEGFRKVDDVSLENGKLTIVDKQAAKTIVLSASGTL